MSDQRPRVRYWQQSSLEHAGGWGYRLASVSELLITELQTRGDFVVFWLDEVHPECERALLLGARMEVPGWRHDFRAEVVQPTSAMNDEDIRWPELRKLSVGVVTNGDDWMQHLYQWCCDCENHADPSCVPDGHTVLLAVAGTHDG